MKTVTSRDNPFYKELKTLADFVIDSFYPECRETKLYDGSPYAALLEAVSARTAATVAQ